MMALISLYASRASSSVLLRDSQDETGRYFGSPMPEAKWEKISGSALRASSSKSWGKQSKHAE